MAKTTTNDLAKSLMEKNALDRDTAQRFVTALFDTVMDGLKRDKAVKVKGLGTFKIIDVEARESVNVNTGERHTIDSHQKITFTPDTAMKELVNKPFSSFETVILNEGINFDDIDSVHHGNADALARSPRIAGEDARTPQQNGELQVCNIGDKPADSLTTTNNQTEATAAPTDSLKTETEAIVEPDQVAVNGTEQKNSGERECIVEPESIEDTEPESAADTEPESAADTEPERTTDSEPESNAKTEPDPVTEPETNAESESDAEPESGIEPAHTAFAETETNFVDSVEPEPKPIVSQPMPQPPPPAPDSYGTGKKKKHTWLWPAFFVIGCAASFCAGYQIASYNEKNILFQNFDVTKVVTHADSTATTSAKEDKVDSLQNQAPKAQTLTNDSLKATGQKENTAKDVAEEKTEEKPDSEHTDYRKYEEMDARVRTGAYRIVGTQTEVTAQEDETLSRIARRHLGPDMECYVEVYNGLKASAMPLKAGTKVKIPKLELKKKTKKTSNNTNN